MLGTSLTRRLGTAGCDQGRDEQYDAGPFPCSRIATDGTGGSDTVVPDVLSGRGAVHRRPERPVSHRLVLHAPGLRSGAAEPQRPHPGGAVHPGPGPLRLPGDPRHRPQPCPHPHRRRICRDDGPTDLPPAGQTAAAGAADERLRAGPRPRPDPRFHVRPWPCGPVRPAVDAALSRHLLPVPSPDRADGNRRRPDPGRHHLHHRGQGPPAVDRGLVALQPAHQPRRGQPSQFRGAARHGHGRAFRPPVGRLRTSVRQRPPAGGRHHRRHGKLLARAPHGAAVGGAGGRRLSRDQAAGDRRHHHRRLHPVGPCARAG